MAIAAQCRHNLVPLRHEAFGCEDPFIFAVEYHHKTTKLMSIQILKPNPYRNSRTKKIHSDPYTEIQLSSISYTKDKLISTPSMMSSQFRSHSNRKSSSMHEHEKKQVHFVPDTINKSLSTPQKNKSNLISTLKLSQFLSTTTKSSQF